ncbi:energy transducer TonB [Thalassotalea ganghwensis]
MKGILSFIFTGALCLTFATQAERWILEQNVAPNYPLDALKNNLEGCVSLQFFVNEQGKPVFIEALQAEGPLAFEDSAIEAVEKWQYALANNTSDNSPERKATSLQFSLTNLPQTSACNAALTDEPKELNAFRHNRLNQPYAINDIDDFFNMMIKVAPVLSSQELDRFTARMAIFKQTFNGTTIEQFDTLLTALNGLSYQQMVDKLEVDENTITNYLANAEEDYQHVITDVKSVSLEQFVEFWQMDDMAISMPSTIYQEISFELLEIEVEIDPMGHGKLVRACREISRELEQELINSIESWSLKSKVNPAVPVLFKYSVPAPTEPGAYYQCDDNWWTEQL